MKRIAISAVAAVGLALGVTSVSYGAITLPNQLKPRSYEGIPYISGGVGSDERSMLASMSKNDNLELSFALQDKEYLGGAKVTVKDHEGKNVLEATSDGPLFYAKLPEGTYTVIAVANGTTLMRNVQIPEKGRTSVYFAWKEPVHMAARASTRHEVGAVAYHK
ncbi:MAG: carboxypeptidase regulatory-like domain-containing protein [Alphaproteobacteria bacterium]